MEHSKRLMGIDGLRAVFCIGIVIYHINWAFASAFSSFLAPVYKYGGYFGNYMFFMISGLLIAYHYKRKIIEKECWFRPFMKKHILKLYPIYCCSNLLAMFLKNEQITIKRTIATFLMMSNSWLGGEEMPYIFPTWFICVLLLCHVLYYFAGAAAQKHPGVYVPLCSGFIIWGMILEKKVWNIPLHYQTCGEGYMNFFIGVLLAE